MAAADVLERQVAIDALRNIGITFKEICSALGYASGSSVNIQRFINGRCRDVGGRTESLYMRFPGLCGSVKATVAAATGAAAAGIAQPLIQSPNPTTLDQPVGRRDVEDQSRVFRATAIAILLSKGAKKKDICEALGYSTPNLANISNFIDGRCRDLDGRQVRLFATHVGLKDQVNEAITSRVQAAPALVPTAPVGPVKEDQLPTDPSNPFIDPRTLKLRALSNSWEGFCSENSEKDWNPREYIVNYALAQLGDSANPGKVPDDFVEIGDGEVALTAVDTALVTAPAAAVAAPPPPAYVPVDLTMVNKNVPDTFAADLTVNLERNANVSHVYLGGLSWITASDLSALKFYQSITHLQLAGCAAVDDDAIDVLHALKELRLLDIRSTTMTSLGSLSSGTLFTQLETLIASQSLLSDIDELQYLPSLRHLELMAMTHVDLRRLDQLANCNKLEALDVAGTGADDDFVDAIAGGCPRLRSLRVAYCLELRRFELFLTHGRKLAELDVTGCSLAEDVTDVVLQKLATVVKK